MIDQWLAEDILTALRAEGENYPLRLALLQVLIRHAVDRGDMDKARALVNRRFELARERAAGLVG